MGVEKPIIPLNNQQLNYIFLSFLISSLSLSIFVSLSKKSRHHRHKQYAAIMAVVGGDGCDGRATVVVVVVGDGGHGGGGGRQICDGRRRICGGRRRLWRWRIRICGGRRQLWRWRRRLRIWVFLWYFHHFSVSKLSSSFLLSTELFFFPQAFHRHHCFVLFCFVKSCKE